MIDAQKSETVAETIKEGPTEEVKAEESHEETEVSPEETEHITDVTPHMVVEKTEAATIRKEGHPGIGSAEDFAGLTEEEIAKKISAFEEDLGMKCPLCRTGGIRAEETAKGKTYKQKATISL